MSIFLKHLKKLVQKLLKTVKTFFRSSFRKVYILLNRMLFWNAAI